MKKVLNQLESQSIRFCYFKASGHSPDNVNRSTDAMITDDLAEQLEQETRRTGADLAKLKDSISESLIVNTVSSRLRLRDDSGNIIGKMPKGTKVTFLNEIKVSKDSNGQHLVPDTEVPPDGPVNRHIWFKVNCNGQIGWASAEYLKGSLTIGEEDDGTKVFPPLKDDETRALPPLKEDDETRALPPLKETETPPALPLLEEERNPALPLIGPDGKPIVPRLGPDGKPIVPTVGADGSLVLPSLEPGGPETPLVGANGGPIVPELDADGNPVLPTINSEGGLSLPPLDPNGPTALPLLGPNGAPIVTSLGTDGKPVLPSINAEGQLVLPSLEEGGDPLPVLGANGEPIMLEVRPDGTPVMPKLRPDGTLVLPLLDMDKFRLMPLLTANGQPAIPALGQDNRPVMPIIGGDGTLVLPGVGPNTGTFTPIFDPQGRRVVPQLDENQQPIMPVLRPDGTIVLPVLMPTSESAEALTQRDGETQEAFQQRQLEEAQRQQIQGLENTINATLTTAGLSDVDKVSLQNFKIRALELKTSPIDSQALDTLRDEFNQWLGAYESAGNPEVAQKLKQQLEQQLASLSIANLVEGSEPKTNFAARIAELQTLIENEFSVPRYLEIKGKIEQIEADIEKIESQHLLAQTVLNALLSGRHTADISSGNYITEANNQLIILGQETRLDNGNGIGDFLVNAWAGSEEEADRTSKLAENLADFSPRELSDFIIESNKIIKTARLQPVIKKAWDRALIKGLASNADAEFHVGSGGDLQIDDSNYDDSVLFEGHEDTLNWNSLSDSEKEYIVSKLNTQRQGLDSLQASDEHLDQSLGLVQGFITANNIELEAGNNAPFFIDSDGELRAEEDGWQASHLTIPMPDWNRFTVVQKQQIAAHLNQNLSSFSLSE